MNMYQLIMNDNELKKAVLVEFGFGEVSPIKVEQYIKKRFPDTYKRLKQQAVSYKVTPIAVENSTREERDSILNDVLPVEQANQINNVLTTMDALTRECENRGEYLEFAYKLLEGHSNQFDRLMDSLEKSLEECQRISRREDLLIHYLASKGLEDDFIQFMTVAKEKEDDSNYNEAFEYLIGIHEECFVDVYGWNKDEVYEDNENE